MIKLILHRTQIWFVSDRVNSMRQARKIGSLLSGYLIEDVFEYHSPIKRSFWRRKILAKTLWNESFQKFSKWKWSVQKIFGSLQELPKPHKKIATLGRVWWECDYVTTTNLDSVGRRRRFLLIWIWNSLPLQGFASGYCRVEH